MKKENPYNPETEPSSYKWFEENAKEPQVFNRVIMRSDIDNSKAKEELSLLTEKYNKLKEAFEELTQDAINLKYQVEAKNNQVELLYEANEKLKHSFESLLHSHIVFKLEKRYLTFGKNGSIESLKEPYLIKAGLKEQ